LVGFKVFNKNTGLSPVMKSRKKAFSRDMQQPKDFSFIGREM